MHKTIAGTLLILLAAALARADKPGLDEGLRPDAASCERALDEIRTAAASGEWKKDAEQRPTLPLRPLLLCVA